MSTTTMYQIRWGHSGTQGWEWSTAREASRYASEVWGEVEATTPDEALLEVERSGVDYGDTYVDGSVIHIIRGEGK